MILDNRNLVVAAVKRNTLLLVRYIQISEVLTFQTGCLLPALKGIER
jgi:hypothetical protein